MEKEKEEFLNYFVGQSVLRHFGPDFIRMGSEARKDFLSSILKERPDLDLPEADIEKLVQIYTSSFEEFIAEACKIFAKEPPQIPDPKEGLL